MIEVTRSELLPGVHLTAVHTKKFKSSVLGLQFLLPLQEETASLNALVPMVLRRGTREHPDLEALSAALDELYGGSLEPMVRKKGETQCVGFLGSFLDDAYTLDGAPLLERAAALLGEVVFHPYTSAGAFCPDYTSQEKTNLIDRIRAQINDKRQYAQLRVVEEMCAGERFGVDKLGSEAAAAAIDCAALWTRYQEMLRLAPVELYYCGSAAPERVRQALSMAIDRQAICDMLGGGETPAYSIVPKTEMDYSADMPFVEVYDSYFTESVEEAQALLDQWKAEDGTEDGFAALAVQNTDDSGSLADGGLYTGISSLDSWDQNFEDWCLDPARQPGDTGLVKNESSQTQGWHIMYFVGWDDPQWKYTVKSSFKSDDVSTWLDGLTENVETTRGSGMDYVG